MVSDGIQSAAWRKSWFDEVRWFRLDERGRRVRVAGYAAGLIVFKVEWLLNGLGDESRNIRHFRRSLRM